MRAAKTKPAQDDGEHPATTVIILLGWVGAGSFLLLSVASLLKEDRLFWRNAGGYPVELREAVLAGYYPLLAGNFILCGTASALALKEYRSRGGRCSLASVGVVAALWALLFMNIGLIISNNLENILQGRPLHYHAPL